MHTHTLRWYRKTSTTAMATVCQASNSLYPPRHAKQKERTSLAREREIRSAGKTLSLARCTDRLLSRTPGHWHPFEPSLLSQTAERYTYLRVCKRTPRSSNVSGYRSQFVSLSGLSTQCVAQSSPPPLPPSLYRPLSLVDSGGLHWNSSLSRRVNFDCCSSLFFTNARR